MVAVGPTGFVVESDAALHVKPARKHIVVLVRRGVRFLLVAVRTNVGAMRASATRATVKRHSAHPIGPLESEVVRGEAIKNGLVPVDPRLAAVVAPDVEVAGENEAFHVLVLKKG